MSIADLSTFIEKRLKAVGLTERQACIDAHLGVDAIRTIRNGYMPKNEKLRKLAPVLKTTFEELLHVLNSDGFDEFENMGNTPDLPPPILVPPSYVAVRFLAVKAGMGGGQLPVEVWGAPRYFEEGLIASLRARPEDLFAMEVDGQSMEPILYGGDQIIGNRSKLNPSEPGIFVLWDGDGIVCKWVERVHGSIPMRLRIFSENPRFTEYTVLAEDAVIHGRVQWFARRM